MLLAFDGTWNELKTAGKYDGDETNVVRFAEWYAENDLGAVTYLKGLGTKRGRLGKWIGGGFGVGGKDRYAQALDALRFAGEVPVDIVGFSRGASLGYKFASILERKSHRRVRALLLFDLVSAMGWNAPARLIPFIPDRMKYHYDLADFAPAAPADFVLHALAVDENRPAFRHTRIDGSVEQPFLAPEGWTGTAHGWAGRGDPSLEWFKEEFEARAA